MVLMANKTAIMKDLADTFKIRQDEVMIEEIPQLMGKYLCLFDFEGDMVRAQNLPVFFKAF
jgi:hypothetical protein